MPKKQPSRASNCRVTLTRPLRFEPLESRHLLSLSAAGYAVPDYVAAVTADGVSPLASSGPTGYTPAQIRAAYGFDSISFSGGAVAADGTGTTIAIVDAYDDPNIASDLHQFDVQFGLSDPVLTKVNQNGGSSLPKANSGWATEIALDVEWAHAIAPGANILLVEAANSSLENLMAAVNYARQVPGVNVVSMSWGGDEFSGENAFDSVFTTPSGHGGVTFVVASGDSGAPVSYPASSPNVLSVGGTTLTLTGQGNYVSESGWSGSGGGISGLEPQPAYQSGVVTQSTTFRTNPDVAYDANPSTGFPVYNSYQTSSPWGQWGGTSDAAPQWAALIAIADQGRALTGQGSLDGATQVLPKLYALPGDFHDVITGNSDGTPRLFATSGYDLVTGLGTPQANLVVDSLVGMTASAVAPTTPGLYDPQSSVFYLRTANSGGFAQSTIVYGPAGASPSWIPLAGDWTGTEGTTIGLYDPADATFYLRDSNTSGYADIVVNLTSSGATSSWIPLVGDWTGSGVTTVGLYDPATSTFYLKTSNSSGSADTVFTFDPPGANASWVPLAGDWTGSGTTTIGLYDPATGTFYLKDANSGGAADTVFVYGSGGASPGLVPLAGNWTGSSVTTVGLYDPATSTFYLKDSNSGGFADTVFTYGAAGMGWTPIVGDWNLTGGSANAASATAKLAFSPVFNSAGGVLPATTVNSVFATTVAGPTTLDEPIVSMGQAAGRLAPMADASYLDAVLGSSVAAGSGTAVVHPWDNGGADGTLDLLADAVAGQPLAKAVQSSLS
jgi:hypothetical protein